MYLEKQIIVYTSSCIESAKIEQYYSDKNFNDHCSSDNWNEEDYAFDQQLGKRVLGKLFSDQP